MALAQDSEDTRTLRGFKRDWINPQKKNPLQAVKQKDAISGSENLGARSQESITVCLS